MNKLKFFYLDGSELQKNDIVMVNDEEIAYVETILIPGSEKATQYSCEEGGFVLVFKNGDVQVWSYADEDLSLIRRNLKK